jgi:chromosome partitioning protein
MVPAVNVTVTSHKGGVGKTITAIHLAGYFAERCGEGSTVLVDLDPNRSSLAWAGVAEEAGRPLPFAVMGPDDEADAEHAIYDSPGRLYGEELEAVADYSDVIVAPSFPNRVNVDVLAALYFDLEDAAYRGRFGVLLTAVPRWNLRGRNVRRDLREVEVPVFEAEIGFRPAFDTAGDAGLLVQDVKVKGGRQGWEDYAELGREVLGR